MPWLNLFFLSYTSFFVFSLLCIELKSCKFDDQLLICHCRNSVFMKVIIGKRDIVWICIGLVRSTSWYRVGIRIRNRIRIGIRLLWVGVHRRVCYTRRSLWRSIFNKVIIGRKVILRVRIGLVRCGVRIGLSWMIGIQWIVWFHWRMHYAKRGCWSLWRSAMIHHCWSLWWCSEIQA